MNDKFQNKFRQNSTRLQEEWDYGWNAAYFVTICTANKAYYFGQIVDGKIQLSPAGEIVHSIWLLPTYELPLGSTL